MFAGGKWPFVDVDVAEEGTRREVEEEEAAAEEEEVDRECDRTATLSAYV